MHVSCNYRVWPSQKISRRECHDRVAIMYELQDWFWMFAEQSLKGGMASKKGKKNIFLGRFRCYD